MRSGDWGNPVLGVGQNVSGWLRSQRTSRKILRSGSSHCTLFPPDCPEGFVAGQKHLSTFGG